MCFYGGNVGLQHRDKNKQALVITYHCAICRLFCSARFPILCIQWLLILPYPLQGHGWAGAHQSCHEVRGDVHPVQATTGLTQRERLHMEDGSRWFQNQDYLAVRR